MVINLNTRKLSDWGVIHPRKFIVAGPCSVESENQLMKTAIALKPYQVDVIRAGIWKPRTRPDSFEGVGSIGFKWIKTVKKEIQLPFAVEVANQKQVQECLENDIDILWIGARTTPNPFAVQEIADSLQGVDIPVMVKNPINSELQLWIGALERLNRVGITRLMAVHRGFSSYHENQYRNKPLWRIPIELKRLVPDLPLICDPSHICGRTDLIPSVAQKAMDLLFDGLMVEVHIDPHSALSDAQQQLTPAEFGSMIKNLKVKDASTSSRDYLTHINSLRKEIDTLDRQIIELLGKRMENARKIAVHKIRDNVSIFQPERWDEVIKSRTEDGAARSLSQEFVFQLFQYIHEESIRQQEEVLMD